MNAVPPAATGLAARLRGLLPPPLSVTHTERWRMAFGALIGILVTSLVAQASGSTAPLPWIVAPMGASAVLVFCLPASPLAQPWAVIAGNTVSALVGVACVHAVPAVHVAAAAAVALSIVTMMALRCLHPPGGATALLMVVAGAGDPRAALLPVLVNAVSLVAAGWAWHRATGDRYPHHPAPPPARPGVTEEDLDAVLASYNEVLDVSRDELRDLVDRTQRLAQHRRLASTRCEDVMTRDVATVEYGTSLQEAWSLLRGRKLKSLPVVDRGRHVVGIVTLTDFLEAAALDAHRSLDQRLRQLIAPSRRTHGDKPEVVGQIMTRRVRVTRPHRTLSDLVALFESTGHRHIPVVGEGGKLVGLITQSDVMAALKVGEALEQQAGPGAAG